MRLFLFLSNINYYDNYSLQSTSVGKLHTDWDVAPTIGSRNARCFRIPEMSYEEIFQLRKKEKAIGTKISE